MLKTDANLKNQESHKPYIYELYQRMLTANPEILVLRCCPNILGLRAIITAALDGITIHCGAEDPNT